MKILITGSAGFFGGILKKAALAAGHTCIGIDLQQDDDTHPAYTPVRGDIRDAAMLDDLLARHRFDAVFHCAAILAHAAKDKDFLWTSNVDGTRNVRDAAIRHGVSRIVFTSSNCLWGEDMGRPVTEDDKPSPVEIYGRSKWEAEKILLEKTDLLDVVIFRCPTIIDEGRLGLLAILFSFIDEGRKVWVVGKGDNIYQFIYAADLADAFLRALMYEGSEVFNIGADEVPSLHDAFLSVARKADTGARVACLPAWLALPAMKAAYALGLSPLGPYQYRMIAGNFVFDTTRIKEKLGWHPTLGNADMLWKAYEYYHAHRDEIAARTDVSAHKKPAKMGVIRVLKWFS